MSKYSQDCKNRYNIAKQAMIDSGRILLYGDFDDDLARDIVEKLHYLREKKIRNIYLYICSSGGEVDAANAILDQINIMKRLKHRVHTIADGKAYSCGAIILAFGSPRYRFAKENASIMLHPISYEMETDYITNQTVFNEFAKARYDIFIEQLAKACGYKNKTDIQGFREQVEKTLWLDADSAREFGIVDGLWTHKKEQEIDAGL